MVRAILVFVLAAVFGNVTETAAQAPSTSEQPGHGYVRGVVTDRSQARVAKAAIVFEERDKEATYRATTNEDGTYEAVLPPGMFSVHVEAAGFYNIGRAPFRLRPSACVKFDFVLIERAIVDYETVAPPESPAPRQTGPFAEEEIRVPSLDNLPGTLVVQFWSRSQKGRVIDYRGFDRGKRLEVVVTYNLLTLRGQTLRLNLDGPSLEIDGGVVLEDGKEALRARRARLTFKHGTPLLDVYGLDVWNPADEQSGKQD